MEFPRSAFRSYLLAAARTFRSARRDRYALLASSIAFFAFLALLPFLAVIALAYGMLTPPERVIEDVGTLIAVLPDSSRRLIGEWLVETIMDADGQQASLLLSTILAVYSATRAGQVVISGLNTAFGVSRGRSFFGRRAAALLLVLCGSSVILAALFALWGLAILEGLVPMLETTAVPLLRTIFWSVATIGAGAVLLIIYRYAPARPPPPWPAVLPGAVAATLLWLAATVAFGYYLGSFGDYRRSYGSIGAVIVLQIWLFLSAYTLLLGARLNAELELGRA